LKPKEETMNQLDERPQGNEPEAAPEASGLNERVGRILFLFGGGLLMSVLVSCACGPVR
jgi:hypothetical protein